MDRFDGTPDDIPNEGFEDIRDIIDNDLDAAVLDDDATARHIQKTIAGAGQNNGGQFGSISGIEQAVRILRFRLAKSDAPERGNEALDFLLAELNKSHLPEEDFDIDIESKTTGTINAKLVEVPFVSHIDFDDLEENEGIDIFGSGMKNGVGRLSRKQVERMGYYSDDRALVAGMLLEAADLLNPKCAGVTDDDDDEVDDEPGRIIPTLAEAAAKPSPFVESGVKDRIGLNEDGSVDDVVLKATSIHIENLGGENGIWIGVNRADGDRFTFECHGEDITPLAKVARDERVETPVTCTMVESSIGSLDLE